jgi:hypothetical protein
LSCVCDINKVIYKFLLIPILNPMLYNFSS